MPVLRKYHESNFMVISKVALQSGPNGLTLKARGLLCTLYSLPDGWEFKIDGLSKIVPDGRDAVRSAVSELEEAGYVRRERSRGDDGKLHDSVWFISDTPIEANVPEAEKPTLENPTLDNPTQYNTYEYSTNGYKKSIGQTQQSRFDEVWSIYPNKKGKDTARKAYEKALKDGCSHEDILSGTQAYADYVASNKVEQRYQKHGSTFFNQRSWQDDWTVSQAQNTSYGVDTSYEGWGDWA